MPVLDVESGVGLVTLKQSSHSSFPVFLGMINQHIHYLHVNPRSIEALGKFSNYFGGEAHGDCAELYVDMNGIESPSRR